MLLVAIVARAYAAPDAPPQSRVTLLLAVVASSVASTAAGLAVRRPHTRALAILLMTFALAALVRLTAWELATLGGERANATYYAAGRGFATLGVVVEALGQLAAAVWLGTRSRAGLALSSLAAVIAFAVTLLAALGAHADASPMAAALHASLATASTLAGSVRAQRRCLVPHRSRPFFLARRRSRSSPSPPILAAAFALALVSRGAFDAPLRAIAIAAAAQWTLVAAFDDRILWASLPRRRPPPESS